MLAPDLYLCIHTIYLYISVTDPPVTHSHLTHPSHSHLKRDSNGFITVPVPKPTDGRQTARRVCWVRVYGASQNLPQRPRRRPRSPPCLWSDMPKATYIYKRDLSKRLVQKDECKRLLYLRSTYRWPSCLWLDVPKETYIYKRDLHKRLLQKDECKRLLYLRCTYRWPSCL